MNSKVKIYSRTLHIGSAELGNTLGGMGEMFGKFFPNENYHLVKQEIQVWHSSAGGDYHHKWRELRFNAQLESGYFLFAIGDFDIDDFAELQEEQLNLSLAGVLSCVFEHLRDEEPIDFTVREKAFLSDPWQKITIEEKIAFEDELEKEISSSKTYNREVWEQTNNHPLAKTVFSALAKNSNNSEVIFATHGEAKSVVAIVNLTWSGKKEEKMNIPLTSFYNDLDEI